MGSTKFSRLPGSLAPEEALERFITELIPVIQNLRDLSAILIESPKSSQVLTELHEVVTTTDRYILSIMRYGEVHAKKRKEVEKEKYDPYSIDTPEIIFQEFARELRTPLAYIKGFSELCYSEELSQEKRQEFIEDWLERIDDIEDVRVRTRDNWKSWVRTED